MASLAMSLVPAFLGSGGGGNSGILGNITGAFGNLISGVGNTISGIGGSTNMGYAQPAAPKSNKTMYYVIGIIDYSRFGNSYYRCQEKIGYLIFHLH